MSVAEVIGLLGGRFEPETRRLHVLSIFPCKSIGTRKECEMDPISEMEAVQQFAAMDLQPVGWSLLQRY
jgi:protein MYSM1